jgi:hypothetical protein
MSHPIARMQRSVCADLFADVRRAIQQRPIGTIRRYGNRRLGAAMDAGIASPVQRAYGTPTIPLGKSSPSSGS